MLKNKSILAISILITTLGITACQPKKTEPETVEPEQTQAEQQSLKLVGDTEKLNLSLPKCEGKNCPEISIERLNSNQAFIDHFIDQKIIQELAQILEIAPQQAASEAIAVENAASENTAASAADAPASNPTAAAIAQVETLAQKLEKQTVSRCTSKHLLIVFINSLVEFNFLDILNFILHKMDTNKKKISINSISILTIKQSYLITKKVFTKISISYFITFYIYFTSIYSI